MDKRITFSFGGVNYSVYPDAVGRRYILLPSKKLLEVDAWLGSIPPSPHGLSEVKIPPLLKDESLHEISFLMNAPLAQVVPDWDYTHGTPETYTCSKCGGKDMKLWITHADWVKPELLCARCLCLQLQMKIEHINSLGEDVYAFEPKNKIGNYRPAIPDLNENGYWQAPHIPADGLVWWRRLPNK